MRRSLAKNSRKTTPRHFFFLSHPRARRRVVNRIARVVSRVALNGRGGAHTCTGKSIHALTHAKAHIHPLLVACSVKSRRQVERSRSVEKLRTSQPTSARAASCVTRTWAFQKTRFPDSNFRIVARAREMSHFYKSVAYIQLIRARTGKRENTFPK